MGAGFGWADGLRLLVVIGMGYGAYVNFKRRPRPFRYEGRACYPLPDGRFCTRWGRIIRDPQLEEALRQAMTSSAEAHDTSETGAG